MKLKDIIDRSILKERGKIYSYITNYYSEINKDEPRTLSSSPEKDTIGKALENPDVWKLYMNHIRDCLKNDFYCDIAADILIQDGKCIIDRDAFGELLKEALNEADEEKMAYLNTLDDEKDENDLPISPERLRDYRIYAACVREAYTNDIEIARQNRSEMNISVQEKSVLNCLARQLGLSNRESRALYMSQVLGEDEKPSASTDDMIRKLVNDGIVINAKNVIYTPEEIIDMIRQIRGVVIERKYMRRIISNMDDRMLNMIRRRHNISINSSHDDKIKAIVESDISPYAVFESDIYPEGTSENDKKRIFSEFVDSRLGIPLEYIQGRTLNAKITSLINYYRNDVNEAVDTISKDGYDQLIGILKTCDKLDKAISGFGFTSADRNVSSGMLLDYDIFAKDLLYMLTDDDLREICDHLEIRYFKNMNTMVLVSKIIENVNSMENRLIENYLELARNDSVSLSDRGIVTTSSSLGLAFQNTTQNIFEKLGIKIADYENPGRKKEHPDIILDFDEEGIVIVECKSGKSPYSKYSAVSRQMSSYFNSYSQQYKVNGVILVANDFTEDFIQDARNDASFTLALMTAESLLAIYDGLKGRKFRMSPLALIREPVVDAALVIRRALSAR